MRFFTLGAFGLGLLSADASARAPSLQDPSHHVFANPTSESEASYRIPSIHESAIQARRVLHLESIGTLSTVYPADAKSSDTEHLLENRPSGLGGSPAGLMDYYADCESKSGNPTILAVSIATSFKNVAAGSNITLSARWHPPYTHAYSAASLPRFSLLGYLEKISEQEAKDGAIAECFTTYHPDAVVWLPGNGIHHSEWARLVVTEVYFIGGFGDRAYIGWIPIDEWRNVSQKEIASIRLPGETRVSSWKEWLLGSNEL
ncbi:MAG: hypothetical protein M1825_002566 [Sarcosagium campestre]|nr:MAG: hypothetical protein M1825_002566 [Sarcosagium campestre]